MPNIHKHRPTPISATAPGDQFVQLDHERTGNALYLVSKFKKVPKTAEQIAEDEAKSATATETAAAGGTLLIGGADDTPVEKNYTLLVMPDKVEVRVRVRALPSTMHTADPRHIQSGLLRGLIWVGLAPPFSLAYRHTSPFRWRLPTDCAPLQSAASSASCLPACY